MRCQYCNETEAIKEVNYMNDKYPQFAWMCKECASNFKDKLNETGDKNG